MRARCGAGVSNLNETCQLAGWPTPNTLAGGATSRSGDRINEPLIGGIARGTDWPDLCIPILTTHEDGRAMLLKGYGNAIVPQAAAVFIRAYADSAT
jgi:hypothetical protein